MSLATLTIDINARLANLEKDLGRVAQLSQSTSDVITSGFAKASVVVTGINQAFELAGKAVAGFQSAASFVTDFVKHTTEAQDEMGKMAQKAGMTTEALSGLAYAADLADVSNEALLKGTKELSKNIIDASRAADAGTTVFGNMGVALKDSAGQLRGTDQVLLDVSEKFAGMADGAGKSALAVKLFGKAGLDLIPFLNQGKDGIQGLTKEAERLGLIVGGDAARASEQFNDNLKRMGLGAEGLKRSIGNAALPVLNELVQQLTDTGTAAGGVGSELRELTSRANIEKWAQGGAKALAWVYDSAQGVVATFQALGTTVGAAIAQVQAALSGDFAGVARIGEDWQQQIKTIFDYEQMRDKVDNWFDEYRRSARINGEKVVFETEEQAKAALAAWEKSQEGKKAASAKFYEFDEATLKKQDALREKYSASEKVRVYGEYQYKKELIEKKYADELALIQGASDQAVQEVRIRQAMRDEIEALERSMTATAVSGNQAVVASAMESAERRVDIERGAAREVAASWAEANAAKAAVDVNGASTIFNTNSESDRWFRGEIDIFGRSTKSGSPGALGNAYASNGRKLSIQEEIQMLNGFAHFAEGGSFMVGGSGGTDSQLVAFKASPDERVTIETPEQQKRGAPVININVSGGSPSAIIAAIKQALRTDPGLFSPSFSRPG